MKTGFEVLMLFMYSKVSPIRGRPNEPGGNKNEEEDFELVSCEKFLFFISSAEEDDDLRDSKTNNMELASKHSTHAATTSLTTKCFCCCNNNNICRGDEAKISMMK
jgi:hypothetical protein